jgi:threonine dehydrogenase-like Zn-dependent dehydrogenase
MLSLIFHKKKGLRLQTDHPVPQHGYDEALIKISLAGVCNTDIEITKGYMDFQGILGHEFVGVVVKCREKGLMGLRVVGEINIGCEKCSFCRNRMKNHCPERSVAGILNKDGIFAEYAVLPIDNLHTIPDSVSDEEAVFVEPLAAAFEIIRQVDVIPDNRVCVLGDGKLGLLVGQVMSLIGCEIIVVGKHEEKLAILKNKGIRTVLSSDFNEKGFDIVIDCTGSPDGIGIALDIIRPGGRVIIKTTTSKKRGIDLNHVVVNELSIIGSRCGPFPVAIKALEERKIDVLPLISKVYPLNEGIQAFEHAAIRGGLKVLLSM